jgi:inner membrane protein
MYRLGHYGAALLAYAPVAFVLLSVNRTTMAVVGGAATVALSPLPDYDLKLPFVSHRGATHTLGFGLVVGVVIAAAAWVLASGMEVTARLTYASLGFVVGSVSIGSHLLADAITPAGITPLWPLSSRQYSAGLVTADNTIANWGLLACGVLVAFGLVVAFG